MFYNILHLIRRKLYLYMYQLFVYGNKFKLKDIFKLFFTLWGHVPQSHMNASAIHSNFTVGNTNSCEFII